MRLRLLLLSPLLILLVLFALSNTAPVSVTLWPTGLSLDTPLSVAILIGMALAFLLGAMLTWFSALPHRRRARRAEARILTLQQELETARVQPNVQRAPVLLPTVLLPTVLPPPQ